MTPPRGSTHGMLTPIEPDRAARLRVVPRSPALRASYATAGGRLVAAVTSSCGTQHEVNEDTHSPLGGSGRLFVVADGVGGGAMAQVASRLLVEHMHERLESRSVDPGLVAEAMLAADRDIAASIARVTERPGAATVALCAALDPGAASWLVAWVGDCRVYRWSPAASRFEALTRDDSFGELGEIPPEGGSTEDPARMVGNGATLGANCAVQALARGDLLALCSDGVHKHLDLADWRRLLGAPLPLAARCASLVAKARANGSVDDATLLLLERRGHERRAGGAQPVTTGSHS